MPRRIQRGHPGLVLVLAAGLLLSGCVYNGWPFRKGDPVPALDRPDSGRAGESPGDLVAQEGAGWKAVAGKRAPHFLIAGDRTECMVSREKWADTVLGAKVFCIWGKAQS